jgi:hypothetical protein
MKYVLHDYEIDAVILDQNKIIFSFPDGFYVEGSDGQELKPLRHKLIFTIDRTGCEQYPVESFMSFRRIKRGWSSWKNISFKEFNALFKKGNMVIHDEYDSKLTNWKMIQLNACTKYGNIEMFITDIESVECAE